MSPYITVLQLWHLYVYTYLHILARRDDEHLESWKCKNSHASIKQQPSQHDSIDRSSL